MRTVSILSRRVSACGPASSRRKQWRGWRSLSGYMGTWKLATIHLLRREAPPRYIAARTTNLEYPELINTGSSARLSDIRAPCSLRLSISPLSRRRSTLPTISRPFKQMESLSIASCLEMFPCSSARISVSRDDSNLLLLARGLLEIWLNNYWPKFSKLGFK